MWTPDRNQAGVRWSVAAVDAEHVAELGDHPGPAHRPAAGVGQLPQLDRPRDVRVAMSE